MRTVRRVRADCRLVILAVCRYSYDLQGIPLSYNNLNVTSLQACTAPVTSDKPDAYREGTFRRMHWLRSDCSDVQWSYVVADMRAGCCGVLLSLLQGHGRGGHADVPPGGWQPPQCVFGILFQTSENLIQSRSGTSRCSHAACW